MSREFGLLIDRHKQLSLLHSNAVMAFSVSRTIQKMKAPNILGQDEAQSNLSALNRYRSAFMPFESTAGYALYMTLARMFVANRDALTFEKIFEFIEQNQERLTVQDFAEYYADREHLSSLTSNFTGLSGAQIRDAKAKIAELDEIVLRLKTVRDEQLAHINLRVPSNVSVNHGEVKRLLECSEQLLNLLSSRYFHSTYVYDVIDEQVESDVISLVHLARLETEHSQELDELTEALGVDYQRDLELQ